MAENIQGGHLTNYSCVRTFVRIEGVVQLPVAGKTNGTEPSVLARLHSPYEMMQVSWTATRRGGPPTVPHPDTFNSNPNIVFLSQTIGAPTPIPLGNTLGHEWGLGGVYTYALRVPRAKDAAVSTGKLPFESGSANGNTIETNNYSKNLLGTDGLGNFSGPLGNFIQG